METTETAVSGDNRDGFQKGKRDDCQNETIEMAVRRGR